jgi:hypothetical protein
MNVKHFLICAVSFALSLSSIAQSGADIIADNEHFRLELNAEYADSTESPLTATDRSVFSGLPFFAIDTNWCVVANFKRANRSKAFKITVVR